MSAAAPPRGPNRDQVPDRAVVSPAPGRGGGTPAERDFTWTLALMLQASKDDAAAHSWKAPLAARCRESWIGTLEWSRGWRRARNNGVIPLLPVPAEANAIEAALFRPLC